MSKFDPVAQEAILIECVGEMAMHHARLEMLLEQANGKVRVRYLDALLKLSKNAKKDIAFFGGPQV